MLNLGLPSANLIYEGLYEIFRDRDAALAVLDAVLPDEFRPYVKLPSYVVPSDLDIAHIRSRREWYWARATALNILQAERGRRAARAA